MEWKELHGSESRALLDEVYGSIRAKTEELEDVRGGLEVC